MRSRSSAAHFNLSKDRREGLSYIDLWRLSSRHPSIIKEKKVRIFYCTLFEARLWLGSMLPKGLRRLTLLYVHVQQPRVGRYVYTAPREKTKCFSRTGPLSHYRVKVTPCLLAYLRIRVTFAFYPWETIYSRATSRRVVGPGQWPWPHLKICQETI